MSRHGLRYRKYARCSDSRRQPPPRPLALPLLVALALLSLALYARKRGPDLIAPPAASSPHAAQAPAASKKPSPRDQALSSQALLGQPAAAPSTPRQGASPESLGPAPHESLQTPREQTPESVRPESLQTPREQTPAKRAAVVAQEPTGHSGRRRPRHVAQRVRAAPPPEAPRAAEDLESHSVPSLR